MELNKQFKITYFAKKHDKYITRNAKWTELCRYWTSKIGDSLVTYFDMDAQSYRTAKTSWTITNTETRY